MDVDEMDWPAGLARTPAEERGHCTKFDVNARRTRKEIRDTLEAMEVDDWTLLEQTGSSQDPGILLKWQEGVTVRAVGSDNWTTKKANLRELYHWIEETRMRGDRPVATQQDNFAAAELTAPDEDDTMAPTDPKVRDAMEILGLEWPYTEAEVEDAYQSLVQSTHPDTGGDSNKMSALNKAREHAKEPL